MKFLAMEKELENVKWEHSDNILKQEAIKVYELQQKDLIREIYFTEQNNAVLVVEYKNKEQAVETLNSLPLVQNNMIAFDIISLLPYTGLQRIINT